jgi:hypothetical protein
MVNQQAVNRIDIRLIDYRNHIFIWKRVEYTQASGSTEHFNLK